MDAITIQSFQMALSCITEITAFDGTDINQLPDFINQVECLMPTIQTFAVENQRILFNYIKNKCTGRTREALHRSEGVTYWNSVKEILLRNFGEKASLCELMDKLKTCRLDSTIENYYYRINKLRNRLHNRKLTHDDDNYTTAEINRITLTVFKEHLPEPTKTMIFARDPSTLEDAYKVILEARHQSYTAFGPIYNGSSYKSTFRTNFSDNNKNNNGNSNISNKYRQNSNNYRTNVNSNRNTESGRNNNYNRQINNDNYVNRNINNRQSGNYNQNNNYNNQNSNYNNPNNNYNNQNNNNYYRNNNNQNNNTNENYNNHQQINHANERSGVTDTQTNQTRSSNRTQYSNQNRRGAPMEIGNSDVNFSGDTPKTYPI